FLLCLCCARHRTCHPFPTRRSSDLVFSLAYGIAQLPCGPLLDRKGPRLMLGLGMFFWSLFQAMSGMVHNFTQFVLVRIGMGIGEAPMNPCGVKVINDWFNIKERGRPMGFFNA